MISSTHGRCLTVIRDFRFTIVEFGVILVGIVIVVKVFIIGGPMLACYCISNVAEDGNDY